jgi:hypothetical protein
MSFAVSRVHQHFTGGRPASLQVLTLRRRFEYKLLARRPSHKGPFRERLYSLPLRIAAIRRGLRRPCITATTHSGVSSGAQAIRYSRTTTKRKGRPVRSGRLWPWFGNGTNARIPLRISSRTLRAASGLSFAMYSQISVTSPRSLRRMFLDQFVLAAA